MISSVSYLLQPMHPLVLRGRDRGLSSRDGVRGLEVLEEDTEEVHRGCHQYRLLRVGTSELGV